MTVQGPAGSAQKSPGHCGTNTRGASTQNALEMGLGHSMQRQGDQTMQRPHWERYRTLKLRHLMHPPEAGRLWSPQS